MKLRGRVVSLAPFAAALSVCGAQALACTPTGPENGTFIVGIDADASCSGTIANQVHIGWSYGPDGTIPIASVPGVELILEAGTSIPIETDGASKTGPYEFRLNQGSRLVIEDGVTIPLIDTAMPAAWDYSRPRVEFGINVGAIASADRGAAYEVVLRSSELMDLAQAHLRIIGVDYNSDGVFDDIQYEPELGPPLLRFAGRYSALDAVSGYLANDILTLDGVSNSNPFSFGTNILTKPVGGSAVGFGRVNVVGGADVLLTGSPLSNLDYVESGTNYIYRNLLHIPGYANTEGGLFIENGSTVRIHTPDGLNGQDHFGARGVVLLGDVENQGVLRLDDGQISYLHVTGSHETYGVTNVPYAPLFNSLPRTMGNYAGGGRLRLDVALGDDASAHDVLFIDGTISGVTLVDVVNLGGDGAQTIDGIPLIYATQAADAAAFTIGQAAVAGAYVYNKLEHRSIETLPEQDNNVLSVGKSGEVSDVWFLMSELQEDEPLYQPSIPAAEALPSVLHDLNHLESHRLRRAHRVYSPPSPVTPQTVFCKDPAQNFVCQTTPAQEAYYADTVPVVQHDVQTGLWAQLDAARSSIDRRDVSGPVRGAKSTNDYRSLSAGYDFVLSETGAGKILAGAALSYQTAAADVTSVYGDGQISAQGGSIAASLTYLGDSGFYLDAQLAMSRYDVDYDLGTSIASASASGIEASGAAGALEIGQRFDLSAATSVTPYAQLRHSQLSIDDFVDSNGALVSLHDLSSTQMRLGVDATWASSGDASRFTAFTLGGSISQQIGGDAALKVGSFDFSSSPAETYGGLRAQVKHSWSDGKYSLSGDLGYETALGGKGVSGERLNLSLGISAKW